MASSGDLNHQQESHETPRFQLPDGRNQDPYSQEKQVVAVTDVPLTYPDPNNGLIPVYLPKDIESGNHGAISPPSSSPDHTFSAWWTRNRKTNLLAIFTILVCVAIAGSLGGSLGNKKGSSKETQTDNDNINKDNDNINEDNDDNSNNPNNTTTLVPHSQSIRPNSRLSVAGWRDADDQDNFNIRLFYQGQDNGIRYSSFDSQSDNWTKPIVAGVDALPGTSLAACANLNPSVVEVNLYHLNKTSHLIGQRFHTARDDSSQSQQATPDDTINGQFTTPLENARLSCYLPYILAQESTGNLRSFNWDVPNTTGRPWREDTNTSTIKTQSGSAGSSIVALPITPPYFISTAFIYRRADGTLGNYALSGGGDTSGTAWAAPQKLTIPIPEGTSIGAFTVARSATSTAEDVNTYILYQDAEGVIQFVWQDDVESGWQGPETFPALAGADKGTDIACVTQAAWNAKKIWVRSISGINRCYFQSQGAVKEVVFDGREWKGLGFIPMD